MSLDVTTLENVRQRGGRIAAACPACREAGADRTGEHLVIMENGKWGCIANAGEAGKEHRRRIAQLSGAGNSPASLVRSIPRPVVKPTRKPALPAMSVPSAADLRAIASVRGWPTSDRMDVLAERGLLYTGLVFDDGANWPAWIVTDRTRANAQARRMDGAIWSGIDCKAKSLPGTTATRCIGATVIGERPEVWLTEGTPDLCAAPIVGKGAGRDLDQIAFVCVTGAGNCLPEADLPFFRGKRVVIAKHADSAGGVAARRWASQLHQAGASEVTGWDFAERGCKDLSDYLKISAVAGSASITRSRSKATPSPAGLCPVCWSRKVVAPVGGPACSCQNYEWPVWTVAEIDAECSTESITAHNLPSGRAI